MTEWDAIDGIAYRSSSRDAAPRAGCAGSAELSCCQDAELQRDRASSPPGVRPNAATLVRARRASVAGATDVRWNRVSLAGQTARARWRGEARILTQVRAMRPCGPVPAEGRAALTRHRWHVASGAAYGISPPSPAPGAERHAPARPAASAAWAALGAISEPPVRHRHAPRRPVPRYRIDCDNGIRISG